jgi:hypothetical protein
MLDALALAHLDVFDDGDRDAAAEALALSLWARTSACMERFKKNASRTYCQQMSSFGPKSDLIRSEMTKKTTKRCNTAKSNSSRRS